MKRPKESNVRLSGLCITDIPTVGMMLQIPFKVYQRFHNQTVHTERGNVYLELVGGNLLSSSIHQQSIYLYI